MAGWLRRLADRTRRIGYRTPPEVLAKIREAERTKATELDLSFSSLKEIPEELSRLTNLTELNLSQNQLTEIPEHLSRLTNLTLLYLSGNPIVTPPIEVCEQGLDAIRGYYRQRNEEGTAKLYEAKLPIVGEAGAGKTTLAQKIQHPDYKLSKLPSTEGIDILRWQFTHPDGSPFRVNIWDFGGQEVYHATHQFFLTKRSCYALVADNRKEDDNLFYWLSILELLADDSPVLIVKNEKGDRARDLNENKLRGEFPQLKDSLATNFATDRGFATLLEQIRHQLSTLPHIGDELPKTWVRVREALEGDPRNTITLDTYLELCEENGFKQRKDSLQLGQYLHDLGVFLHFQDDDLLCKTIILKPTWGTDAVYKVLDNDTVVQNQGCFSRQDLDAIWSDEQYTGLRGELLQLMMKFQLCYELPYRKSSNRQRHYIAPQLLSPNQPKYHWEDSDNLILRYTYEFMPKGILTRFIVALHEFIVREPDNPQVVWRTGVLLERNNTRAEVSEFYEKREIKIRLQGENKRGLREIIAHELQKIHDSFHRLKVKQLIPFNCNTCKPSQTPHMYDLKRLERRLAKGQLTVECDESYDDVDVRGLIDDSFGDRPVKEYRDPKTGKVVQIFMGDDTYQSHSGSGDNVGRDKRTNT